MKRTMMTGSLLAMAAMVLPGCAVEAGGSAAGSNEKTGTTSEALVDNGEGWLRKPIGLCSGQFAICNAQLGFYNGGVTFYGGYSNISKFQAKIWEGTSAWNGPPLAQNDNFVGCQASSGCPFYVLYESGHAYTVVVQACTENWDGSYDCGVGSVQGWNQATIQAPNFKWASGVDNSGNYLDPTNWMITPGGFDVDGTHLAVCMAEGHPGKARYFGDTLYCDIGYGGQEKFISQQDDGIYVPGRWTFQVLFTSPSATGSWQSASNVDWGQAFTGGRDGDGSELYVCRVWMDGSLQPGKVIHGPGGSCNVGFGGAEQVQPFPNYEVYIGPPLPTE